jgi:hypothetical protein
VEFNDCFDSVLWLVILKQLEMEHYNLQYDFDNLTMQAFEQQAENVQKWAATIDDGAVECSLP